MKHVGFTIVKVLLLMALCMAVAFAAVQGYYFTLIWLVLPILALTVSLCFDQRKVIRRMEQMIARIRYADLHATFTGNQKGVEGALNHSMNEAMAAFRKEYTQAIVSKAETEAWQKLIRVLAHEMMNSLAPIISLSETVIERASKGGCGGNEYTVMLEAMESIHRRSSGLLHFVENYRRLVRMPDPEMRVFKIGTLFDGLQKLFSGNHLHFTIQPNELVLHGDYDQMEQVLINLIKNAMEACSTQGDAQIAVRAYRHTEGIAIQVADNGTGIDSEAMDKIFVPFYTTKQNGSGIGLSLSRQIVVRHEGWISVTSETGKGTTVTLILPVAKSQK